MAYASITDVLTLLGENGLDDRNGQSIQRFRAYLQQPKWCPEDFDHWIRECLHTQGRSGRPYHNALQDIVVTIGRHLGMAVDYGCYAGTGQEVPWDGHWETPDHDSIIVEVKCSAWPTATASQLGGYLDMQALRTSGDYRGLYGLYVVGRGPTQHLIEQIKGGEHRSRLKVIACSDLLRLWRLKLDLEGKVGPERAARMAQGILMPFESVNVGSFLDIIEEVASREAGREGDAAEPGDTPPIYEGASSGWSRGELFDYLDICQPNQVALLMALAYSSERSLPSLLVAQRMQLAARQLPQVREGENFNARTIAAARAGFSRRAQILRKESILETTNGRYRLRQRYAPWVREWLRDRTLDADGFSLPCLPEPPNPLELLTLRTPPS